MSKASRAIWSRGFLAISAIAVLVIVLQQSGKQVEPSTHFGAPSVVQLPSVVLEETWVPQANEVQPEPHYIAPSHEDFKKQNVLIVGAAGYIGSFLAVRLATKYNISAAYDRNDRAHLFPNVVHADAKQVNDASLAQADVVIYLGGFTGRVACESNSWDSVMSENVHDLVAFAKRMRSSQLLLFASTSAIGEGSGTTLFREDDEPRVARFDKYTKSLLERESAMRSIASSEEGNSLPVMVAMRFGTIIGVSPSQRQEFVHVAMVRSALLEGRITVRHPETARSFLALEDLFQAITTMIEQRQEKLSKKKFNLFHLVSFSSTIGRAAAQVASVVGVPLKFIDHKPASEDVAGFTLSSKEFQHVFGFEFKVTELAAIHQIVRFGDHVKVGREITDRVGNTSTGGPRCRVCGSRDIHEVLNLGDQALANDFQPTADQAMACPRHPLRLHRCRKCSHAQLSNSVDRKALFTNYSYRSGTSRTLEKYFTWLAERVDQEVKLVRGDEPVPDGGLRILELACNDGSQLNQFKKLGWATYGVDPAANLVVYAKESGHTVATGLWGAVPGHRYPELPLTVDAVVAQNVLAHVPDPNSFVAAIVAMMHDRTLVYLQTSQCEMFHDGQFDTIYHEHISFFSPGSFAALAAQHGLRILRYEVTPIHGGSCFVTFGKATSPALAAALDDKQRSIERALAVETQRGHNRDAFYIEYRSRVQSTGRWVGTILETAAAQGITTAGYGAAAKGMVLLLYALSQRPNVKLEYVVDDAPLKQNNYCPNTRTPIKPTSHLATQPCDRDLLLVVFSWNFWEEIRGNIVRAMMNNTEQCGRKNIWVVLPFPSQRIVTINLKTGAETTVATNPFAPPALPLATLNPDRRRVLMVTHMYNEAFLLPYFIRHHASMFDHVVVIDCGSTDGSADIVKQLAPSNWEVVNSTQEPGTFEPEEVDLEVMSYESQPRFAGWWKVALTTTEFIVHRNLRALLHDFKGDQKILRFRSAIIVGDDSQPLKLLESLAGQRHEYTLSTNPYGRLWHNWSSPYHQSPSHYLTMYSRFIHQLSMKRTGYYKAGRHELKTSYAQHADSIGMVPEGFIMKFMYSPWDELLKRKLQIGERLTSKPPAQAKFRNSHHEKSANEISAVRQSLRENSPRLSLDDVYADCSNDNTKSIHRDFYEFVEGTLNFRTNCSGMSAPGPLPNVPETASVGDLIRSMFGRH